jgi:hypothetical protein
MQLSGRVEQLKRNLHTEEATKTALVLPMLQVLGCDVFNPQEVVAGYVKKGEKIDYAVIRQEKPVIFVKCKHWKQGLTYHDESSLRYLYDPSVKYCILTNGIIYKFYLTLTEQNRIDEKSLLEVNLSVLEPSAIEDLYKFHKSNFDIVSIQSVVSEMKYTRELRTLVRQEFTNPTPELVLLFTRRVYGGIITSEIQDMFTVYLKAAISGFMSDTVLERFKTALTKESGGQAKGKEKPKEESLLSLNDKIMATKEETEGFIVVRSIVGELVDADRIVYRDAINYFAVLLDDDDKKPVCRLYFGGSKKYVATFSRDKTETMNYIESYNDITDYSGQFKDIVQYYLELE